MHQMPFTVMHSTADMLTLADMLTIGSCSRTLLELCLRWGTSFLVSQAMMQGVVV